MDLIERQAAIDTNGFDEEIRCKMCRNQMKTDRGCDGNCKYDEKLYEKIMQILNERIKPLPSAQPEIIRCKDCKWWSNDDYRECSSPNYDDGYVTPAGFYCGYAERRTDERTD